MNRDEASERIADRYGVWPERYSDSYTIRLGVFVSPYAAVIEGRGTTWREAFDALRWILRGRAELARVVCEHLRWLAGAPIVVPSGDRCQACHSADPARPNVPWCMACRATLDERSRS